ncbi:MAG: WD40 repeat domain-containing protein [Saprospiraceae bacterium]|nr:WD40 repeat domain-containing protein [Saprospiraceae bacterium]
MKYLLLVLLILPPIWSLAQCTNEQYHILLNEADKAVKRGEYDLAVNKLQSAKVCRPDKEAEVEKKIVAVFEKVNGERKEAVRQREKAEAEARRIYANDLAYKSQTVLRDGDRTTAFRLAELAHRYVDSNNSNVLQAMVNAFYCNEDSNHLPLPWTSNINGHSSQVNSLAFAPGGKCLATGSNDGTAKIWDVQSGTVLLNLIHTEKVMSVAFSPDGKHLATNTGKIKVWNLETGVVIFNTAFPDEYDSWFTCVTFSPDGKSIATGASGDYVNKAQIWDLETGKTTLTLSVSDDGIDCLAFSPDGKRLATGSKGVFKSNVVIWDLETGNSTLNLKGGMEDITSLAFSPDGKFLATGAGINSTNGTLLWNLQSGKIVHKLLHTGIYGVAFSPDGKFIATASSDQSAKIWDVATGKSIFTLLGHTNLINSIAFSPDGKCVATGSWDYTIKIWDIDQRRSLPQIGETKYIYGLAFSPEGKHLGVTSAGGHAKIWDLDSGKNVFQIEDNNYGSIAFSSDGKLLATGSQNGTAKVREFESGKAIFTLVVDNQANAMVNSVAFSPDSKFLGTCTSDSFKIWNLNNGNVILKAQDYYGFKSLSFSPDSKLLATVSSDKTAKIWDLNTGKPALVFNGHTDLVNSVAFSPDGRHLATGSDDNTAKIWDLKSRKLIFTLEGHMSSVNSVAYSPAGNLLATGSNDKTVKIWDLKSRKIHLNLAVGFSGSVSVVAFSPGGEKIATGGGNTNGNSVNIWKITPDDLSATAHENKLLADLSFSQLKSYGLSDLLSLHPTNEAILRRTEKLWQIAAFGDLYAQKITETGFPQKEDYNRAMRLYDACLSHQKGNDYFEQKIENLKKTWVEKQ